MKHLLLMGLTLATAQLAQAQQLRKEGIPYTFTGTVATGSGTMSYQWYRDGQPIEGATSQNYIMPSHLAYGTNVEFKRGTVSSACPYNTSFSANIIITFMSCTAPASGLCCTNQSNPLVNGACCNSAINNSICCDNPACWETTIGGVRWAGVNVAASGSFAAKPDMYTQFYQWNRTTAWAAAGGSVSGWNGTSATDASWTVNPCPDGWRLPTNAELTALHNSGTTWVSENTRGAAVFGRFYGPNHATAATCSLPNNMSDCVFLPESGYRNNSDGILNNYGSFGLYWSSTSVSSTNGYSLGFDNSNSTAGRSDSKGHGFNIRCVK